MLNKMIGTMGIILLFTGCGYNTNIVYRDVARPMLICPAPPEIEMPELYISTLTDADRADYGKVAQYYNITIRQLLDHIEKQSLVIDRYNKTSESYEEMNMEFEIMYKQQRIKDEISGN